MASENKNRPASSSKPRQGAGGTKNSPKRREVAAALTAEPVLSGRMILAVALCVGLLFIPTSLLGKYLTKKAPQTTSRAAWKVGQTTSVHLTVVTSDYNQLACADTRELRSMHCEHRDERQRWAHDPSAPVDDNKAKTLQPYRTTDQNLLLVAGLWAQPEVAMRIHNEPPNQPTKGKLARFAVACDVKFLQEWDNALIRWTPAERWSSQGRAMVGEIVSCKILVDGKL